MFLVQILVLIPAYHPAIIHYQRDWQEANADTCALNLVFHILKRLLTGSKVKQLNQVTSLQSISPLSDGKVNYQARDRARLLLCLFIFRDFYVWEIINKEKSELSITDWYTYRTSCNSYSTFGSLSILHPFHPESKWRRTFCCLDSFIIISWLSMIDLKPVNFRLIKTHPVFFILPASVWISVCSKSDQKPQINHPGDVCLWSRCCYW